MALILATPPSLYAQVPEPVSPPDTAKCSALTSGILAGSKDAAVVKTRDDGSKIFQLETSNRIPAFFREEPIASGSNEMRRIFDDPEMPIVASTAAKSLGFNDLVPEAIQIQDGMELNIGGAKIHTRAGSLQKGITGLVTPIDEFKKLHPGIEPHARDIQTILNQGEWPRLYANWKIFWIIFNQTDLSIENLARSGKELVVFDLGDLLNLPGVRAKMGITEEIHNLNFNMPGKPSDRVEYRADFRRADPEFKNLAHTIASESDEATAARLGKQLNDSFKPPRGRVSDHVRAMKDEARRIVNLLDKGPFDY